MDDKQKTEQQDGPAVPEHSDPAVDGTPEAPPAAEPEGAEAPAATTTDAPESREGEPPAYSESKNTGGMKPAMVAALCVALVLITALVSAAVWRGATPWVAKVNGETITQAELYDVMYENVGSDALQNLITEKLIAQEAKTQNVTVTKEELDERLNSLITRQFGSEEQFQQLLAMYNMTRADFEDQIKTQVTVEKILEPDIDLKEEELSVFFEENRERFVTPAQAAVRHVLSETREEAETVRAAIADGADFAEVAAQHSADEATASQGGVLPPVNLDDSLPTWLKAAFSLTPGELSGVLEGDDGYHVLEITDLTPATTPELEDVKDEVREAVLEEKMMGLYPEWLNNLLENADIEYRDR